MRPSCHGPRSFSGPLSSTVSHMGWGGTKESLGFRKLEHERAASFRKGRFVKYIAMYTGLYHEGLFWQEIRTEKSGNFLDQQYCVPLPLHCLGVCNHHIQSFRSRDAPSIDALRWAETWTTIMTRARKLATRL